MSSYFDAMVAQRGVGSGIDAAILDASADFVLDPALIKAVIAAESAWVPTAVRQEPQIGDASYGLMQVLLGTARDLAPGLTPFELLVPETNVRIGSQYLAQQLQRFGWPRGVYAYNAGPGNVERNTVPASTLTTYYPTVAAYYDWYVANDPALGGALAAPFRGWRGKLVGRPRRVGA